MNVFSTAIPDIHKRAATAQASSWRARARLRLGEGPAGDRPGREERPQFAYLFGGLVNGWGLPKESEYVVEDEEEEAVVVEEEPMHVLPPVHVPSTSSRGSTKRQRHY